jgi:hypothetical protein
LRQDWLKFAVRGQYCSIFIGAGAIALYFVLAAKKRLWQQ